MSYQAALKAAGAVVHAFEEFGTYQGDWLASVELGGKSGIVRGSYGSCSGCDAFEGEFGYSSGVCDEHLWGYKPVGCPACQSAAESYTERLARFGANYLNNIEDPKTVYAFFKEQESWDSDASAVIKWINALQDEKGRHES